ncbi:COMM domain-containing protein 8-like [Mytilus edulis]|uniref:COMM domain-containing protein 8-like n=1 Tax=Mytilus edulis TaxID=6550 RepID=UPI0039EF77FE
MTDQNQRECLLFLGKLDSKQTKRVLHSIVDGICKLGRPIYQEYGEVFTLPEWWNLSDAYTGLVKQVVKEDTTKDQILEILSDLPDGHKQIVLDVISVRRDDVQQSLKTETSSISDAVLTDFDWQVKLALSSDKIASVQEPITSLDLDVQSQQGQQVHSIELNREDLKKLITSLEGANKVVQQLKS